MRIFGFKYCTGVMFCDLDVTEQGDYKEVAYVWENGEINWKVPAEQINREGVTRILAESQRQCEALKKLQNEYKKTYEEYSYVLNMDKDMTLKECNIRRWLIRVREEISDLLQYKTTAVVH